MFSFEKSKSKTADHVQATTHRASTVIHVHTIYIKILENREVCMERVDAFNYVLNFHLWTTELTVAQHRSGGLSLLGAAMLPAFRKCCTERGGLRPLYKRAISSQIFSCGEFLCQVLCPSAHTSKNHWRYWS